ncbi:putative nucleotidyltransferase substrate binding domain-containing protein [Uliginosibacterium sp. H3]|uniref:Nucleotidyltransferase substrate binding domain-containing protein n=1 Tax=Uliginosibacterium silvisoli TaxID=3114758 RepID=A0ABU6K4M4_9RHOO|nr:putative nucleotidyltransferase substrate binding domain-containing protein [Uliginosibacterium sp. H3]
MAVPATVVAHARHAAEPAAFSLYQPLSVLIRRAPVTCPTGTVLREAVARMVAEHLGAIVVVNGDMSPLGIVTAHDLLARVLLAGGDLDASIDGVMSTQLVTLPPEATTQDALRVMARHAVRYVLVVGRGERLVGVVSRTDVYGTQQIVPEEILGPLASARSPNELADAAATARRLARRLVTQGLAAEKVIQWTSSLNDLVTARAIELMKVRFPLPDLAWSWVSFGSKGRLEQTLSTEQNNGIVFALPEAPGAALTATEVRAQFLPFAQAVNQLLDECGFPLGRGQGMAGNAEYCLALTEWQDRFRSWTSSADSKGLASSGLFFDFRSLYGCGELVETLRSAVLALARSQPAFLKAMASNALLAVPPLGMVRTFIVDKKNAAPNTIDLKATGVRPYVDAVRVLALTHGISATGTVERLRALVAAQLISEEDAQAAIDGFQFLQMLRLRNQQQHGNGDASADRLNPYKLNRLERQILRHAFMQSRGLQQRLKAEYKL